MRTLLSVFTVAAMFLACSAQNKKYQESCSQMGDCNKEFVCKSSVCDCPDHTIITTDARFCRPGVDLGQMCGVTEQCLIKTPDTFCSQSYKCECAPGYGFEPAQKDCSVLIDRAVAYGGKCKVDRQCKTRMVCAGQTCDCKKGLRWDIASMSCRDQFGTVPYGESCERDGECNTAQGLVCVRNVCECRKQLHYDTTLKSCAPDFWTVPFGGPCRQNLECKTGLVCVGTSCACTSAQNWDHSAQECFQTAGTVAYGDSCRRTQECMSGMVCAGSACGCMAGRWNHDALRCLQNDVASRRNTGTSPAALSAAILVLSIVISFVC